MTFPALISLLVLGKWHLGWDDDTYGDQKHGPLGHGFDSFFGLPLTLVDGFEMDMTFWTYSGWMSNKEVKFFL